MTDLDFIWLEYKYIYLNEQFLQNYYFYLC